MYFVNYLAESRSLDHSLTTEGELETFFLMVWLANWRYGLSEKADDTSRKFKGELTEKCIYSPLFKFKTAMSHLLRIEDYTSGKKEPEQAIRFEFWTTKQGQDQ